MNTPNIQADPRDVYTNLNDVLSLFEPDINGRIDVQKILPLPQEGDFRFEFEPRKGGYVMIHRNEPPLIIMQLIEPKTQEEYDKAIQNIIPYYRINMPDEMKILHWSGCERPYMGVEEDKAKADTVYAAMRQAHQWWNLYGKDRVNDFKLKNNMTV